MRIARSLLEALALAGVVWLAGCDKDPTLPQALLSATCPAGPIDVSAALSFPFSAPVTPATISSGNIVIENATTGFAVPGALSIQGGNTVVFRPSERLPYSTLLRVRLQNVTAAASNAPFPLVVCQLLTVPPPLTPAWNRTTVSGANFVGVSAADSTTAYLTASPPQAFRVTTAGGVTVALNEPHFAQFTDIGFANSQVGFITGTEGQTFVSHILRTTDAGNTWSSVFTSRDIPMRVLFKRGPTGTPLFGLVGGGTGGDAALIKYRPEADSFDLRAQFTNTAQVNDLDFTPDTSLAAAVSAGFRLPGFFVPGFLHVSTDGGNTWTQVPQSMTDTVTVTYWGVGVRSNGEIYVVGGNGYVARYTAASGSFTVDTLKLSVTNLFPADPRGLFFSDVQFAPDDDRLGWIIGAQQVGVQNGSAVYQGLIFETRDGGRTWTRQGVRGAAQDGAEFPRLNRIDAFSSTKVWIVGDQGTVLQYAP